MLTTGTIADDGSGAGVYQVSFTPSWSGSYSLFVMINGLHVAQSPYTITVSPAASTVATSCNFTLTSKAFTTGDHLTFFIMARDSFGNLRPASISDAFAVTLTGAVNTSPVTLTTTA